jgi:endonuclease/exonuclease/phosphatase family metal-dependent hydrolase
MFNQNYGMSGLIQLKIFFSTVLWLSSLCSLLYSQSLEIWQIQGNGLSSPYAGTIVTTESNVVTAVGVDRFFMQTPQARSDDNPATSDGILVEVGAFPNLQPGDVVTVTGRVLETGGMTHFGSSALQISVVGTGAALPLPVELYEDFPTTLPQSVPHLEWVEGMLVSFTARVAGPSDGNETAAVSASVQRPFREPGITWPGLPGLPVWDGNPEIFRFDPDGLGAPNNRFLSVGMEISATAVIIQENGRYVALPKAYTINGSATVRSVRARNGNEVTIGSANVLRLFPGEGDYLKRVRKLARYIVFSLQAPDILAMQEVGSLAVLQDLSFYIRQLDAEAEYTPYLTLGYGDIHLGFLVRNTVRNASVSQLGKNEYLSIGGVLHDRPPLLLECTLATDPPTPLKVLNVHLRSLIGIEGQNSAFVRTKRYEQAVSVASMVENLQDGNLVVVGDFNAYEFSDGYVDVVNQIAGLPGLGAQFPIQPIVQSPPANHTAALPQEERYSYVYEGSAQLIDHCLTVDLDGITIAGLEFARGNADNATAYAANEFLVHRASDHDGFVLFLQPDNPLVGNTEVDASANISLRFSNPIRAGDPIYISSPFPFSLELINMEGKTLFQTALPMGEHAVPFGGNHTSGVYLLRIAHAEGTMVRKVISVGGR